MIYQNMHKHIIPINGKSAVGHGLKEGFNAHSMLQVG